jgi:hypothetical protein
MQTNTSRRDPDWHIMKNYILWPKGMCLGSMDPHAVTPPMFRLNTALLDNMHALMSEAMERMAKNAPRPGRSA